MGEKIMIRDFLRHHLDKKDIDGLDWVDREKGIFMILWKHGSASDYDVEKDSQVFREYAKARGMYENDKEAIGTQEVKWKQNFRNALRKRCVYEIPNNTKDLFNYKLFKFHPLPQRHKPLLRNMPIAVTLDGNGPAVMPDFSALSEGQYASIDSGIALGSLGSNLQSITSDILSGNTRDLASLELGVNGQTPGTKRRRVDDEVQGDSGYDSVETPLIKEEVVEQEAAGARQLGTAMSLYGFPATGEQALGSETHVSLFYEEQLYSMNIVKNAHGVKLCSEVATSLSRSAIESQETVLCFPSVSNTVEEQYQMEVETLHHAIGDKGVTVQCVEGDLYATRYCRCKVYYSNYQEESISLVRNTRTPLFTMAGYNDALGRYLSSGARTKEPTPDVTLDFGQNRVLKSADMPILISVRVRSARALTLRRV